MNCNNCGFIVNEGNQFCNNCGTDLRQVPIGSVGYSSRINDPAFKKYLNKSTKWSIQFSVIIAIIAIVGFFITGEISNDMDNPESLFIGMAVGAMFMFIALFQTIGKKKSTTWDGQVIDKVTKNKKKKMDSRQDSPWLRYTQYTVVIQNHAGKRHKIVTDDNDSQFNYFQIGDHVRHHQGLNTYEKYDKTKDSVVFCNACSSLNNHQDEYCQRCKCPLLK